MKTDRKKILEEVKALHKDDLEKLQKFIASLKNKKRKSVKVQSLSLKGKLDKVNVRSLAYE